MRYLPFAAIILLFGAMRADASPNDAFLDGPLPAEIKASEIKQQTAKPEVPALPPPTYVETLARLRAAIPRPILLPNGLEEFIAAKDKERDWNKGKALFLSEGTWTCLGDKFELRSYLNRELNQITLDWTYDPKRDVIVTDFLWHQSDNRSANDLISVLKETKPIEPNLRNVRCQWQIAFDALLSKPDNFRRAWPVRFCADQREMSLWSHDASHNLTTGVIKDDAGGDHFLVVNDQEEFCNPGPEGSFSYYLFDAQGHFEEGGVETIGYRCFRDSAWLERDGQHLDVRTWNNGRERRDLVYNISKGHLIRTNSLVDGTAPTGWALAGFDSGERLYTSAP